MTKAHQIQRSFVALCLWAACSCTVSAQSVSNLDTARELGRNNSRYQSPAHQAEQSIEPDLLTFKNHIGPTLRNACLDCHGPDTQEANFRIDTLEPNLVRGGDIQWWLEVMNVVGNSEMPPADSNDLTDEDRTKIIDWLSGEIRLASLVQRREKRQSAFRRLTRYEFTYALQDLLALPYDFGKDLPPETLSDDGFANSSNMLQMSSVHFNYFRELGLRALRQAVVTGSQPEPIGYSIPMRQAAEKCNPKFVEDSTRARKELADKPEELETELARIADSHKGNPHTAHFLNLKNGQTLRSTFSYHGAKMALSPSIYLDIPVAPATVLVLPTRREHRFDIGDHLPTTGNLRVRVRAGNTKPQGAGSPSLRLRFGFQASNDSNTSVVISKNDTAITASAESPEMYEWVIPLADIPRNPYRGETRLGDLPNPAEYFVLENVSPANTAAAIQIEYLELTAPFYHQWPPQSHLQVFGDDAEKLQQGQAVDSIFKRFMQNAWRRPISKDEVQKKVTLYHTLRPTFDNDQEAILEVLATVLASPQFLYVSHGAGSSENNEQSKDNRLLANRLALFLWSSLPDQELSSLAASGALQQESVLLNQVDRMLRDPKAERFAHHFVQQWLGMELLDNFQVDKKAFPRFDHLLKEAMQQEPVEFFLEIVKSNGSIVDFLHSDYALLNERLANHYGIENVHGNTFRKVSLKGNSNRGGILTQAGLLAMNSDGKDSHPLKRGIWLLEHLLNDPPPPPPPAVPEIDLADPEIAKLSLKDRLADHRNQPACQSCHSKIDPWGIAFENFDATGNWRDRIGDKPVDAQSRLFNDQELNGIKGLKSFLLSERQDQFARAFVHKLTTYALGRPLSFGDRAAVDEITRKLRQQDDRFVNLVKLIVISELFQTP